MDDQLRAVALDDGPGGFLAEDVDQVGSSLEGGDGCEVRSPGVENTTSEHCDPPALSLVQLLGQLGHDGLHLLQHLGLLGSNCGSLVTSGKLKRSKIVSMTRIAKTGKT